MGLFYLNKWTPANAEKAIEHFEHAIAEEPEFILPYAGLARCYGLMSFTGYKNPKEAATKALTYGNKALTLDANNIEAHLAVAVVRYFYEWDWDQGLAGINKALEINPNSPEAHLLYSLHYIVKGQIEKAILAVENAYKIDPVSFNTLRTRADMYYFAEQYDVALKLYDDILYRDPHFLAAREFKGWAKLMQGNIDEAIEIFGSLGDESSHAVKPYTLLSYAYAIKGDLEQAHEYLARLDKAGNGLSYDYAVIHVGLGNFDKAFEYLDKCYAEKLGSIVFLKMSPIWKPLRTDPRYADLVKRLKLG
jgi:tetratricopeptide (TPR) repeat protein